MHYFADHSARAAARLKAPSAVAEASSSLSQPAAEEKGAELPSSEEIESKLVSNYGLGTKPEVRKQTYSTIVFAYSQKPRMVLNLLRVLSSRAALARNPEHYFLASIKRELSAKGLWSLPPDDSF